MLHIFFLLPFPGASTRGGGGGGGRIALYHTGDNHFSGQLFMHGGYAAQQYGGAGTVYTEDRSNGSEIYRKITADNNGFTSSARVSTTRELGFQHPAGSNYATATSLRSYSNVSMTTDGAVWRYYYPNSNSYYDYSFFYVFDGALGTSKSYITSRQVTNVTLTFPYPTMVSHLHICPLCR